MNGLKRIFQRQSLYSELAEEMQQHLEEKTQQFEREGLTRKEAKQAAKKSFGNVTLIEEQSRETWQWPTIENLLRDISFSARLLKKSPGFTLVAILTLTLGIGANTAIFSLLNGLLLRPLPVPNADRLVSFSVTGEDMVHTFCPALARILESRHDVFSSVFIYAGRTFGIQGKSSSQPISGVYVNGQYFAALGVAPELGRALTSADDSKDSKSTVYPVVISDAFWTTHFNRDPGIIGKPLVLSKVPFTVVGVMPKTFFGFDPTARPAVWVPLVTESRLDAPFDMINGGYQIWWLNMGARLRPGVSLAKASAWLRSASSSLVASAIPDPKWSFGKARRNQFFIALDSASGGYSYLRSTYRNPLLLIFVFCCALLLLACINLASLLLARAAVRQREIATRLAIGASRRRILQQLLIDSFLVALFGSAAGLILAPLASHALVAMLSSGRSHFYLDAGLDWRVCLFVAAIAAVSTVLVGLLPAWQATAGDINHHLKDGAHATRPEHRRLLPKILLAVEVALALVIVSAAGLLSTSLYRLYHDGFGFDPHNLLLVDLDFNSHPMKGVDLLHLYSDLRDRFAALPGVQSAAYAEVPPLSGNSYSSVMRAPGGTNQDVDMNTVNSSYLATIRIPLLSGRTFTRQDASSDNNFILLNQSAARLFFPKGDAVGKIIEYPDPKAPATHVQVIGIVGDTKYQNIHLPGPPMAYDLIATTGKPSDSKIQPSYTFILRTIGPPASVAPSVRSIVTQLAPGVPAPRFLTMEQQISEAIIAERLMALLSVFFAVSALLVTGIGLYGVLAWSTARRTSEIGVRMALGAQRIQVVALIFRENLWTALIGSAAGLATAILISRVLVSFLYGTSPRSPWILSASLAVLCLVAAAASLIPAIRAARTDPMQALRAE